MVFVNLGEDDDVVQVDQTGLANLFLQDEIHEPLKGSWSISEAECKVLPR